MSLKEIFCQEKAIDSLQRAYAAGRMAHAYLFAGDDGVGKFTTARGWANLAEQNMDLPFFLGT